jgi:hypothetical protein
MSNRVIRLATAAVVTAVATFAAIVSFSHIYDLGRGHGQAGTAARLGTSAVNHATVIKMRAERRMADAVDEGQRTGEIASRGGDNKVRPPDVATQKHRAHIRPPNMSTLEDIGVSAPRLNEARNRRPAPPLARFALWLGILATLGANAAYGAPYGPLGVVVSTWPAVSFVIAVEVALGLVHRAHSDAGPGLSKPPSSPGPALVPSTVAEAAKARLRSALAQDFRLSDNELRARFGLTRAQATEIRSAVLAESNGHTSMEESK